MTLDEKYQLAVRNLQAIAQYNDAKAGYVDEWTQADAFNACRTAAVRALNYLGEATELPNHANAGSKDRNEVSPLSQALHEDYANHKEAGTTGRYELVALDDAAMDDINRETDCIMKEMRYAFADSETKKILHDRVLSLVWSYVEAGRIAGTPAVEINDSGGGCLNVHAYSSTKITSYR